MTTTTKRDIASLWMDWAKSAEIDFSSELEDGSTPQMWIDEGIAPQAAIAWMSVGGFNPEGCAELVADGIAPSDCESRTDEGWGGYRHTIAYKYCNGDLSLDDVRRLIANA